MASSEDLLEDVLGDLLGEIGDISSGTSSSSGCPEPPASSEQILNLSGVQSSLLEAPVADEISPARRSDEVSSEDSIFKVRGGC